MIAIYQRFKMSSKKKKLNKRKKYKENKINDNNKTYNHLNNNGCNKNRKNEDAEDINNGLGANTYNLGKISDEDMESLRLLSLQLKAILLDYCGDTLLWNSTVQGIQYILEKYDRINDNEHTSTLAPYVLALQSAYAFLAAKLILINISFTRFNIVSKKKAEGTFKYSLQPNIDINIANALNLIVSYYFIRAAQGIVMRDNVQPVFGF